MEIKVLIFNSLYYPNIIGGAERSVQILAEGLSEKGVTPVVVSTSDKNYVDYVNGVKVYYVKIPNLYWMKTAKEQPKLKKPLWHLIDANNLLAEKKIEKILKKEKPDIINTNNLSGFSVVVWKVAKKRGYPIVHTIRDYYLVCPSSTMFKRGRNCEKQCNLCRLYSVPKKKYSNIYVDGVIGVSEFILNKHLNLDYFQNSKIKVHIYNAAPSVRSVEKGNVTKEEIVIGIVGVISPSKGTEFVLKRFKALNPPNTKLFVYGRGITKEYEKKLKEEYSSPNIVFKGFREPETIYNELDIIIIPSLWHEPFPRILIESFSHGIPILASNRGGIPENVIEGKTGLIFDPDKEGDFENKLSNIISYFRKNLFNTDEIVKFSEQFNRDLVVEEYFRIYKTVSDLT